MASSTAETTTCGSMPFSRLSASITLESLLAIILLPPSVLDLRDQVGFFNVRQRDLDLAFSLGSLGTLALLLATLLHGVQVEHQFDFSKTFQAPFKVTVAVLRFPRTHLHQAAAIALTVRGFRQLAIKPGR